MTLIRNVNTRHQDSPDLDAFGRLRVSETFTLFDSKQIFDNAPLFWDDQETSGGGTGSSHSVDKAATIISVDAVAGKRIRQTYMRFNYQSGKSQLCDLTMSEFDTTSGNTKEMGLFDNDNGLFFRSKDGLLSVVRRSKVTGAVVDVVVDQVDWNIDGLGDSGNTKNPSGITLDETKHAIAYISFGWLGGSDPEFGFVIGRIRIPVHRFAASNTLAAVYMSTPNLPVRYSIENDGTGAADDFVHICATVISEGGKQDNGILRYRSTSGTHINLATQNTIYAILGIKLKSTHIGASIDIVDISMAEHVGSKEYEWLWILNPTIANSGSFNYANEVNSAIQTAQGNPAGTHTVTNGTIMTGGMASSAQKGGNVISQSVQNALRLGSTIDGIVDAMVLCARPLGGSSGIDIEGSITWRELS